MIRMNDGEIVILANLWPHAQLYDEALCVASVNGGWVAVLVEPHSGETVPRLH